MESWRRERLLWELVSCCHFWVFFLEMLTCSREEQIFKSLGEALLFFTRGGRSGTPLEQTVVWVTWSKYQF